MELGLYIRFGSLYPLGVCHVLSEISLQDIMRTRNDDDDYDNNNNNNNNAIIIGNDDDDVKLAMHSMYAINKVHKLSNKM